MNRLMIKPTKWPLRPAKTQISLGIHPVWSAESSLSAWSNIWSSATHWAHCEDSDQTGRMPRLIWVFAGRTDHFVGFVMSWLNCELRFGWLFHFLWLYLKAIPGNTSTLPVPESSILWRHVIVAAVAPIQNTEACCPQVPVKLFRNDLFQYLSKTIGKVSRDW